MVLCEVKDILFCLCGYAFVVVGFRCFGFLSPVDGAASSGSFRLLLSIGIECLYATGFLERFAYCHESNTLLHDQLNGNSDESVRNVDEKWDPRE